MQVITTTSLQTLRDVPAANLITPTPDQLGVYGRMRVGQSDTKGEDGEYTQAGFPSSDLQNAFFEHLIGTNYNLGLDAKAGTGKTTTIEAAVRLLRVLPNNPSVLFLAFNKTIATELRERFDRNGYRVDVATVHSQAFKGLRDATRRSGKGPRNIRVNGSSFREFVRAAFRSEYQNEKGETRYNYADLAERHADVEDFDPSDYVQTILKIADMGRLNLTSKPDGLEEVANRYHYKTQADEVAQAARLLKEYTFGFMKGEREEIDYTDMLWLPNVGSKMYGWKFKSYDFVFVDEAQDLSTAQRELVSKFVSPRGGRQIFVGDPNQAIYAFAGASSDSFQKLVEQPNTKVLPLNLCYRCGSEIIKVAQGFVPTITAHKSTGRGSVLKGQIEQLRPGDLVIGRLTAPLVSLCLFLIRNRIQATVLGSDIGEGLITAIRRTKQKTIDRVLEKLWEKYDKTVEAIYASGKVDTMEEAMEHQRATSQMDVIDTLQVIADETDGTTYGDLIREVRKIFSKQHADITLMTAHRSKGLEADNVFVLNWMKDFPHKSAKTEEEIQQEANLQYVAVTRAKKRLRWIDIPEEGFHETPAPRF